MLVGALLGRPGSLAVYGKGASALFFLDSGPSASDKFQSVVWVLWFRVCECLCVNVCVRVCVSMCMSVCARGYVSVYVRGILVPGVAGGHNGLLCALWLQGLWSRSVFSEKPLSASSKGVGLFRAGSAVASPAEACTSPLHLLYVP